MLELTFGEQVKIILSRKGMTIKELAEKIEKQKKAKTEEKKEEAKTATVPTTELIVRKETLGEKIRKFFKNLFKRK